MSSHLQQIQVKKFLGKTKMRGKQFSPGHDGHDGSEAF
jgi:hypothetical protein